MPVAAVSGRTTAPLVTPFWLAEPSAATGVILTRRTPALYRTLSEIHLSYQSLIHYLDSFTRPQWSLLLDFRAFGPGRNDDNFEKVTSPLRKHIVRDFFKVAALVRSNAGLMQLTRTSREDQRAYRVYDNAEAARAYVLRPLAVAS